MHQFTNPKIEIVLGGITMKLAHGSGGEYIGIAPIRSTINTKTNRLVESLARLKAILTATTASGFMS